MDQITTGMTSDQAFYLALAGMLLTTLTTLAATIWGARNAQAAKVSSAANSADIAEVRVIVNGSRDKLFADLLDVTTRAAHAHGMLEARATEDARTAQVAQALAAATSVALAANGPSVVPPAAPAAPVAPITDQNAG